MFVMKRAVLLCLAMAISAMAQGPRVGIVEIFGVRKISDEKVIKAIGVTIGGPLPPSKVDAEERVEELPGVVKANLEAVCCEKSQAILYVGIEEKGAPHFELNTPPNEELKVPEEVEQTWIAFLASLTMAVQRGNAGEDLSKGHSLMFDADAKKVQESFVDLAETHFQTLRDVLRKSADDEQRGMAAYVLGYSSKKKIVADDLQYAMRDSSPVVRNNAMRALSAIAVLGNSDPDLGIKVPTTWFVEMLNSIYFTDRNKASLALLNFTEKGDDATLQQIRERALPALMEMSEWKSMGHALPAFILLGRVAGLKEEEIQTLWKEGKRTELYQKFKKKK